MKKRLAALLLCLAAFVSLAAPAFADASPPSAGTLTYMGGGSFDDAGVSGSLNGLFASFTNVVPGDEFTERLTLKNGMTDKQARLFVRASPSADTDDDTAAFLAELTLTVRQVGSAAGYTGAADGPIPLTADDGSERWIPLGTLASDGEAQVDVTLAVPLTLDNDFQGAVGAVTWTFMAEELEDNDPGLTIGVTVTSTPENGYFYDYKKSFVYSLTVKNTGGAALRNVTVYDPFDNTRAVVTLDALAPDEERPFSGLTHEVTADDVVTLQYTSLAALQAAGAGYFQINVGYWTNLTASANATALTENGAAVPADAIELSATAKSVEVPVMARRPGDVNVDGVINVTDVRLAKRLALGRRDYQLVQEAEDKGETLAISFLNAVVADENRWKTATRVMPADATAMKRYVLKRGNYELY